MGKEPGNLRRGGKWLEPPQPCDHHAESPELWAGTDLGSLRLQRGHVGWEGKLGFPWQLGEPACLWW